MWCEIHLALAKKGIFKQIRTTEQLTKLYLSNHEIVDYIPISVYVNFNVCNIHTTNITTPHYAVDPAVHKCFLLCCLWYAFHAWNLFLHFLFYLCPLIMDLFSPQFHLLTCLWKLHSKKNHVWCFIVKESSFFFPRAFPLKAHLRFSF